MRVHTEFDTYLERYTLEAPCEVEHKESGMNNTTRMIKSGSGRYVLRIYNNHKDADIARLEHEVLEQLSRQALPFQVPEPVRNKLGETVSVAEDGTLSALFRYIEGERPSAGNPAQILSLGRTAAQLTCALSRIAPIGKPLYSPYYELESTYSEMDEAAFLRLSGRSEELKARRAGFDRLHAERRRLLAECEALSRLPKQWIHGDLVLNNTVVRGDEIAGVLDFEFTTVDVRPMELAVIAADLIKAENPSFAEKVKTLLRGYLQSFPLPEEELVSLPLLMKLRFLDVALHFAVRLRDGLDGSDVLCGIIDSSDYGCCWINEHWEEMEL